MSRIGKKSIVIPEGVSLTFANGIVTAKGPKGTVARVVSPLVTVNIADGEARVSVLHEENKKERSLWGTYASHIHNMVTGVSAGFRKQLEINGVGYRVAMQGKDLKFEVGYSHSVVFAMPEGVVASAEKNVITVESADKELLGRVAAEIRNIRKPEPYKGKGIKYADEVIRRKAGKTAAKASA